MYISEMALLKARLEAEGRLSQSRILQELLREDDQSERKEKMREGERYYRCDHDVRKKDFRSRMISETKNGAEEYRLFQNPNRSNHHNVNPFHRTLVAQKAAYLVGKEPTVTVKGKEQAYFEAELAEFCNEEWNQLLYRWVTGASNKGVEYLHVYYDENGVFRTCLVPAEELIVCYDAEHQQDMTEVIRYYDMKVLEDGKEKIRRKVEWWTKEDVTYFTENSDGEFLQTKRIPHWLITQEEDGQEVAREEHHWGRLPFIPLQNNAEETTDLELIKGLVDAYDLLSSEGTNQLLDLVELYWVIQGYGGEAAGAISKKLQINKAVQISDSSGHVEAKQVSLPMESRMSWMRMLRKDIFHFGMGVDTDSEDWGKAPSGVALQFQYAMFYLKVNGMMPEIRRAIKEVLRFVAEDKNRRDGRDRDWKAIQVLLNTSGITDDLETVQMIRESQGLISEKTLLGKHPFVDDVNHEMQQRREERKEKEATT